MMHYKLHQLSWLEREAVNLKVGSLSLPGSAPHGMEHRSGEWVEGMHTNMSVRAGPCSLTIHERQR